MYYFNMPEHKLTETHGIAGQFRNHREIAPDRSPMYNIDNIISCLERSIFRRTALSEGHYYVILPSI